MAPIIKALKKILGRKQPIEATIPENVSALVVEDSSSRSAAFQVLEQTALSLQAHAKDALENIDQLTRSFLEDKSQGEIMFLSSILMAVLLFVVIIPLYEAFARRADDDEVTEEIGEHSHRVVDVSHDPNFTKYVRSSSSSVSSMEVIEESEEENEVDEDDEPDATETESEGHAAADEVDMNKAEEQAAFEDSEVEIVESEQEIVEEIQSQEEVAEDTVEAQPECQQEVPSSTECVEEPDAPPAIERVVETQQAEEVTEQNNQEQPQENEVQTTTPTETAALEEEPSTEVIISLPSSSSSTSVSQSHSEDDSTTIASISVTAPTPTSSPPASPVRSQSNRATSFKKKLSSGSFRIRRMSSSASVGSMGSKSTDKRSKSRRFSGAIKRINSALDGGEL